MTDPLLLAVDGSGSKLDAVALSSDGEVHEVVRLSKHVRGREASDENLEAVSAAVALAIGGDPDPDRRRPRVGVFCLAGADLPQDEHGIERWLADRGWTEETVLQNDTFAVLRTGTERAWGVGSCAGSAPTARLGRRTAANTGCPRSGSCPAIGAAGRTSGPPRCGTPCAPKTDAGNRPPWPRWFRRFGMRRPNDVMEAMYLGRVAADRVSELAPLVFATADGDSVARSIVDRQADEIVTMATASIRALDMEGLDVDVVLGGGIVRNRLPAFFDRIRDGVARTAPRAAVVVLSSPAPWKPRSWPSIAYVRRRRPTRASGLD